MNIVYFSSVSENTHRFVTRFKNIGYLCARIPLRKDAVLQMQAPSAPYVLVTPTYGGGTHSSAVPKQVIHFLNVKENRERMIGVVAAGNRNFGSAYALAGDVVSAKCGVPLLARFEVFGTSSDFENILDKIRRLETCAVS